MVKCVRCGTENPNFETYCRNCGNRLFNRYVNQTISIDKEFCPSCSKPIERFSLVCPYCNAEIKKYKSGISKSIEQENVIRQLIFKEKKIRKTWILMILSVISILIVIFAVVNLRPFEKPEEKALRSYFDAANNFDAKGMIDCTILTFDSIEDYSWNLDELRNNLLLDYFKFQVDNVEIIPKIQLENQDISNAEYDILIKENDFQITIMDYCLLKFNITRTTLNESLIAVIGVTQEINDSIFCYKVDASWYLAEVLWKMYYVFGY